MDSLGFANHLISVVSNKLKSWEENILAGSFKTADSYQNATGVVAAFRSIVEGIPAVHTEFNQLKEQANNNIFSIPVDAIDVENNSVVLGDVA